MGYPRSVNKFIPWSKAMVAGATVDKPDYGKNTLSSTKRSTPSRKRRRKRRRKSRKNATKET